MSTAGNLLVRIRADISDFQNQFGKMQKSLKKTGQNLQSTGKSMTKGLTAPLLALGTGAVITSANFEKSMNKVAAMSGATGSEFDALREQAKELGATTLHSASDAADGMSFLAMAGFETNEIMEAMPSMLDLATASGMDLAQTADIASNILTGFGLEAKQSGRMADVLAKASSSANTDVGQMGEAMSFVAPVAQGAGISLEETAAAVGMLSDAGIQGGRAGTTLRKMISSLQNPVGATKDVIEDLGLSMKDLDPSIHSVSDILDTLNDSGIDSAQAMKLVGDVAGPGLIAMLEQGGDGLKDFEKELLNAEGSAAEMAEIMGGGMYGAFKSLMSAVEGLAIEFGDVLAPVVLAVAEVLITVVRWFSSLSTTIKTVIAIIAGIVAAIGPLLIVLGLIMTAVASLTLVMIKVIAIISLVVGVVGLLVAAFIHLWNTSDEFRDSVLLAWEMIKEGLEVAAELIIEIFTSLWEFVMEIFDMFLEYWEEFGEQLMENVAEVFQGVYEVIETILNVIWEVIQSVLDTIKDLWDSHGETVMSLVDTIFGIIWDIINGVVTGIRDFIKMILDKISAFWDAHGENIMKIIDVAMKFIGAIISAGMSGIQAVFEVVWPFLSGVVSAAWDIVKAVTGGAFDVVSGIIGFFVSLLTGDFAGAWSSLGGIVTGIWDGIVGTIKGAINIIIGAINMFIRGMNKISFSTPSWVPIIGGKDFGIDIPEIPKLATGGIAGGATLAEIGEGAHPEMVAPLNDATMAPFANLIAKHMGPQQSGMDPALVRELINTMKKDKVTVIEMDSREVGRHTEKHVTRNQGRKGRRRQERR